MDMLRLWQRNLGRDDRLVADTSRSVLCCASTLSHIAEHASAQAIHAVKNVQKLATGQVGYHVEGVGKALQCKCGYQVLHRTCAHGSVSKSCLDHLAADSISKLSTT